MAVNFWRRRNTISHLSIFLPGSEECVLAWRPPEDGASAPATLMHLQGLRIGKTSRLQPSTDCRTSAKFIQVIFPVMICSWREFHANPLTTVSAFCFPFWKFCSSDDPQLSSSKL